MKLEIIKRIKFGYVVVDYKGNEVSIFQSYIKEDGTLTEAGEKLAENFDKWLDAVSKIKEAMPTYTVKNLVTGAEIQGVNWCKAHDIKTEWYWRETKVHIEGEEFTLSIKDIKGKEYKWTKTFWRDGYQSTEEEIRRRCYGRFVDDMGDDAIVTITRDDGKEIPIGGATWSDGDLRFAERGDLGYNPDFQAFMKYALLQHYKTVKY